MEHKEKEVNKEYRVLSNRVFDKLFEQYGGYEIYYKKRAFIISIVSICLKDCLEEY